MSVLKLISFTYFLSFCRSELSNDFRQFIRQNYGETTLRSLERADLGSIGSFGGGTGPFIRKHVPLIFVHGMASTAGTSIPLRIFYESKGYTGAELYATTYGPYGHRIMEGGMRCEYVQQVRSTRCI